MSYFIGDKTEKPEIQTLSVTLEVRLTPEMQNKLSAVAEKGGLNVGSREEKAVRKALLAVAFNEWEIVDWDISYG